jgi:hypothetical protein
MGCKLPKGDKNIENILLNIAMYIPRYIDKNIDQKTHIQSFLSILWLTEEFILTSGKLSIISL